MTVLVWILAIAGAAWAWLCAFAAGMSTVPRFRTGSAVAAAAPSVLGLILAIVEGSSTGWGFGLVAATALMGFTCLFLLGSLFSQPSPPSWTRAVRRALFMNDGLPRQHIVRRDTPFGEVRIRDFRRPAHAAKFGVAPSLTLGDGPSQWGYGIELLHRDAERKPAKVAIEAGGVLTCLGQWSLAVEGDRLLVAICNYVVAFELPSLRIAWHQNPGISMTSLYRDAEGDGAHGTIVCSGHDGLCGFGPDGEVRWRQPFQRGVRPPQLFGGYAYVASVDGGYMKYRTDDGAFEGNVPELPAALLPPQPKAG